MYKVFDRTRYYYYTHIYTCIRVWYFYCTRLYVIIFDRTRYLYKVFDRTRYYYYTHLYVIIFNIYTCIRVWYLYKVFDRTRSLYKYLIEQDSCIVLIYMSLYFVYILV